MLSVTRSGTVHPVIVAIAIAGLALSALTAGLFAPASVRGATHVVTIGDGFFSPASLTINAGDTVTWVNEDDSPHTATGDNFDSGNLEPGASFSHTFTSAGSFGFVCSYHDEMTGAITVAAAQAAPAAGSEAAAEAPASATAATAPATAAHSGGHEAGQPNTALPTPASGIGSGWLATVLIGLALVAFAFGLLPTVRAPRPRPVRRAGGWRR